MTSKMRAYASCDQLSSPSMMTSTSSLDLRKNRLSMGSRPGRVVVVYDGRRWPVVRCGSVYVSADDTARRVTQSAVTCTTVAEKKRRAGKYTVAVGTSHGHVQAFLEDSDNVLDNLDRCQAEDKCLMLIKRPKESARKMLKSHSLTQMSVSDPQLYRHFNGMQLTQVHQHAQTVSPPPQDEQMDARSVSSNNSNDSSVDSCRRYTSVKDSRGLLKQPPQYGGGGGYSGRRPTDYNHRGPDGSATNDMYQYLPRRTREPMRRDLRYSSIPEDEDQEINNNSSKGSDRSPSRIPDNRPTGQIPSQSTHHSPSHTVSPSRRSSAQQQQQQQQLRSPNTYDGRARNGPANAQGEIGSKKTALHDPGSLEGDARSKSLGSVSAGLATFSLVGQRKADSMPSVAGPPGSSPHHQPRNGPGMTSPQHQSMNGPGMTSPQHQPRQGQGGSDKQWDNARGPARAHNRNSLPNGHPAMPQEAGQSHRAPPSSQRHGPHSGFVNGGVPLSPSSQYRPQQPSNGNVHHAQHVKIGDLGAPRGSQGGQYNMAPGHQGGHELRLSGSDSLQAVLSPLRNQANIVPASAVSENSEKIKRMSEVMRSRMSDSSCGDVSTTPSHPHTPSSRHSSLTDAGWDSEVSTLLEVKVPDDPQGVSSLPRGKPSSGDALHQNHQHHHDKKAGRVQGCEGVDRRKERDGKLTACSSSAQGTPSINGDQHSDGGHTSFTSHSHSSTMDSGYTTNTEGDCDSSVNNQQISPPYHPPPPPHPIHIPQAQAETYRPVPMPRNLFPTAPRNKCSNSGSSSSNSQKGGTQQQTHTSPGHVAHTQDSGNARCSEPRGSGHASQCNGNPAEDPHQHRQGGGDSGHSGFRSLDCPPVVGARPVEASAAAGFSGDDVVVKPQAARSGNGSGGDSTPQQRRRRGGGGGDRTDSSHHSGAESGSSSSSLTEHSKASSLTSSSQPAESSSNSVITVPGQWNNSTATNTSGGTNSNNPVHGGGGGGAAFHSSPRAHHPHRVKTSPAPSLFQLSQSHDLTCARLSTPPDLPAASSLLSLTSVQVTVPADTGPSAQSSPQGHCARIGGPGSAFRPVRAGSTTLTLEMTAVESVDPACHQHLTSGDLLAGDVLLEVNGWQCLGHERADVQALLDTLQEVTLVLARKRQLEADHGRVEELESSVNKLRQEVQRLTEDLSQRDSQLSELSSMLPWTQDVRTGAKTLVLQSDDGAIVIGENEFVV